MASTSTSALSLSPSSALVDGKAFAPPRQSAVPTTQCVGGIHTLTPPPVHSPNGSWKSAAYCRKVARDVIAMATGGASASAELATTELPDIVKTAKVAWEKVEDKYAVSTLAAAGGVTIIGLAGLLSAVDRLPLIPGLLEIVGIGYTGWFAYKNLFFKPDREALIRKIRETYSDII